MAAFAPNLVALVCRWVRPPCRKWTLTRTSYVMSVVTRRSSRGRKHRRAAHTASSISPAFAGVLL